MLLYVGLGILVLWILGFIAFHVMIKANARIGKIWIRPSVRWKAMKPRIQRTNIPSPT